MTVHHRAHARVTTDRRPCQRRYQRRRAVACFFRAALFVSLGGWAFLAALVGLYYDSLAVAFVASPLFFGLMAFALRELERAER